MPVSKAPISLRDRSEEENVSLFAEPLQEPRFTSQPSNGGNILSENRTKFLQCQARGKNHNRDILAPSENFLTQE